MLRIGIVGTGLIAWAHGLSLRAMTRAGVIDAEITAVHDPNEERAAGFAGVIGTESVRHLDEVLERCDAVWVCTPTSAHRSVVDAALSAERAVFCEKPLATDLLGAQGLCDAAEAAVVPAQAGLVLRSAPVFAALREVVGSEEFGRPMAAVFRDDQYFPIQGTYGSSSAWRADVAQAGGGCLIEHSIHDLDILRYCFGEVASVTALTANFVGHVGIEDVASVSMEFESGLSTHLTSVWHNILSRGSTRRIEVFFEHGLVWLDDEFCGPLHIETSDGSEERACPSPAWVDALDFGSDEVGLAVSPYVEENRNFVDAVVAGRPPEPGLNEALIAHRLVDAAYRSAEAGGAPVTLW